jgi:hypothetical protein
MDYASMSSIGPESGNSWEELQEITDEAELNGIRIRERNLDQPASGTPGISAPFTHI